MKKLFFTLAVVVITSIAQAGDKKECPLSKNAAACPKSKVAAADKSKAACDIKSAGVCSKSVCKKTLLSPKAADIKR